MDDKLVLTYFDELGAPFSIKASHLIRNNNPENSYLPGSSYSQSSSSQNDYLKLFSTIENYDLLSNQTNKKSGFSYSHSINQKNSLNLSFNKKNNYYSLESFSYDPIKSFVANGPSINYSFKEKELVTNLVFKRFSGLEPLDRSR